MGTMTDFPEHDLTAYRADPRGEPRGAVVVIQEIWGLTEHIKHVTDRLAAQGFVAVAPDLLRHVGLTPDVGSRLFDLVSRGTEEQRLAAPPALRAPPPPAPPPVSAAGPGPPPPARAPARGPHRGGQGRVAVVGFCFGGTYAYALAAADPRLGAAVPFYGTFPEHADPATITCPVLAFYGEEDHGITDGVPELEARMADAGVDFTARVYHGVGHAFFNDDSPSRYNAEVAGDAWQRTLAFFETHLGAGPDEHPAPEQGDRTAT